MCQERQSVYYVPTGDTSLWDVIKLLVLIHLFFWAVFVFPKKVEGWRQERLADHVVRTK